MSAVVLNAGSVSHGSVIVSSLERWDERMVVVSIEGEATVFKRWGKLTPSR